MWRGGKRILVGIEKFFLEDFQEPYILGVSGFMSANVTADGSAEKVKVSDDIEDFVSRKFILKPEFGVDDFTVSEQDEVIKFTARGETHTG